MERVENIKFLGVQISQDLSWNKNTSGITKKVQQRLYFLRKLKRASLPSSIFRTFYSGVVESVLTYWISTWYSSLNMSGKKALQRIVREAERVNRVFLLSVQELFSVAAGAGHWKSSGPTNLSTHSLNCCHPENGSGVKKVELTDLSTASFHKLLDCWTADLEHVHWCASWAPSHSFSFKLLYLYIECYLFWLCYWSQRNVNSLLLYYLWWYSKITIKLWLIDWLIDWLIGLTRGEFAGL